MPPMADNDALHVNLLSSNTDLKSPRSNMLDIIDIRRHHIQTSLKDDILSMLRPDKGPKTMPTLLLYNERGLQLFEKITYLPEYYLTNEEIDVLRSHSEGIAKEIPDGSLLIELGSGNLRKVTILLQALETLGKSIDYYALDLSQKELRRTLEAVPNFKYVKCHGLHGTYDDGLEWLKRPEIASRSKCIMSLGSSIGNFPPKEAASFLKNFTAVLGDEDSMLIGLDGCNDPAKVYHAYNDSVGTTHEFILNGLLHANQILGEEVFNLKEWKVIGEYIFDEEGGRHQAFYSPVQDISFAGIKFSAGEKIRVEQSFKFSPEESRNLWSCADLHQVAQWGTQDENYNLHLLKKKGMAFPLHPRDYAANVVPTMSEWEGLWQIWDAVTRGMVPEQELLNKPIKLRNAVIFYLGHIPTFLDLQINKSTQLSLSEPTSYPSIFERGIDPDVENPEHCHSHSEIPDEWPPLDEILSYQKQVREKVRSLYDTQAERDRQTARGLWVGFEHEAMHLETLLYMLLQSDKTLPPPGTTKPDFAKAAKEAAASRVPNQWFEIPEQRIDIGLDDPEDNSGPEHHFGWDNEKPPRSTVVPAFKAAGRAITNEEFARFLEQTHSDKIPASWAMQGPDSTTNGVSNGHSNGHTNGHTNGHHTNGHDVLSAPVSQSYLDGKMVRTVYGLVPLKYALDWPVFASYNELSSCAKWMGGRIPTFEEARSIYDYVDASKTKEAEQHLGKTVPAVNGHLSNNGVEISPPQSPPIKATSVDQELFVNLAGANVGFQHWHPVPVTAHGDKLAGQGEMGGVWEWTSSELTRHEGFEPMRLYPNYTADFFDGKHNIVLGGSWATHPRIAGRKTFVNWYQRNYPYAWAGARLVKS